MITTDQLGARLERSARLAAPVIALAITAVALLMQLAYDLGFLLGTAVHERSAQLAAVFNPPQPVPPPAVHPLALIAAELDQLTCKQLQQLTGCRRRIGKQQLIALALGAS